MKKTQFDRSGGSFWVHVRWIFLAPALLVTVIGVGLLLTEVPEQTRYFLSGVLIGVGVAATIGELAWAFERRELREANAELRQPILSQCRGAYRMGEFFFPFYAEWTKGEVDGRHVTEFLDRSEPLGIRQSLESVIADDPNMHGNPYEYLREKIEIALAFLGQHVVRFFRLGDDLTTLRSAAGESTDSGIAARNMVVDKTTGDIREVTGFFPDAIFSKAWIRFTALWGEGHLTDEDVGASLVLLHSYLLALGNSESDEIGRQLNNLSRR